MIRKFFFLFSLGYFLNAQIVVIPIEGDIEPSVYNFLKRAVADGKAQNPDRIVFNINTFGGELNTTFQIVELISGIDIPTISFVDEKAISAGTLIAMASRQIYMKSNSIMGDVAPVTMGAEGPQMLGEKFQSPLRAKFRSLAQKNGYPVKLSEAFVSAEKEIIQIKWEDGSQTVMDSVEFENLTEKEKGKIIRKKTLVAKGELLTMSEGEAMELGFSSGTVSSIEDLIAKLSEEEQVSSKIIPIDKTQAEKVFSYFLKYSWLFILIGLGGIYLEVKNPGFGFYGILAIIALGIFFIGYYIVELASYMDLILLLLGLLLLAFEILVLPGFGIFGALGIALLLGALVLMQQGFVIPEDVFEWDLFTRNLELVLYVFLGSLVVLAMSFFLGSRFMYRNPLVFNKRLFEPASQTPPPNNSPNLTGHQGIAITKLSPSGKIEIDGRIYNAVVLNDYLNSGNVVRVVGKDGYLLIVELVEDENK